MLILIILVGVIIAAYCQCYPKYKYTGDFRSSNYGGEFWKHKKVLVLSPHPDDDINLAGEFISGLKEKECQVVSAIVTNGDSNTGSARRIAEGLAGAAKLGLNKEDVVFLGYSDYQISSNGIHMYNGHEEEEYTSKVGNHSYGIPNKQEFCFDILGVHHKNTKQNIQDDIQMLLLHYQPDYIFAVDVDNHPDHRMFSFLFERAMGNILSTPGNAYFPRVFKGFAYAGSYLGPRDFYDFKKLNVSGVRFEKSQLNDGEYETDNPFYRWTDRIRVPVGHSCLARTMRGSNIYASLQEHLSQGIIHNAKRIINNEQVYWERPTTSLTYQSKVAASSGDASKLKDFLIFDTNNVLIKNNNDFAQGTWVPDENDRYKTVEFKWPVPQTIGKIVLYGNLEKNSQVLAGKITMSNGFCDEFGAIKRGEPLVLTLAPQREVTSVAIQLTNVTGRNAGLNEVEIFAPEQAEQKTPLPLLKLMIEDEFAYDYWVKPGVHEVELQVYAYDITPEVELQKVNNDDYELVANKVILGSKCHEAVIKAVAIGNPDIYDQIVVRPVGYSRVLFMKMAQGLDAISTRMEHVIKTKFKKC